MADLVIPIPNFVPNGRMGLAGALAEGYNMAGGSWGGMGGVNGVGTGYLASQDGSQATGIIDPKMSGANQSDHARHDRRAPGGGERRPLRRPGGMGGGAQADFDTLIELITTTVKPQTWDEVGGPGSISEFPNNLSLVISQTQDVHEEIVDLLEQLRRLQDLQVTIEVRFITLNDNFFERIGVDFDSDIVNDQFPGSRSQQCPATSGAIVGLHAAGRGAPVPELHRATLTFRSARTASTWPRRSSASRSTWPTSASPSSATSKPICWSTPRRATAAATCCKRPR